MADLVLQVGSYSEQGLRPNNEDRFVVDLVHNIFLVADGMGGQDRGEQASGMAADIIPRVVQDRLAALDQASDAVRKALSEANEAIINAGKTQPEGRRMGTTAGRALREGDRLSAAGWGDGRAYLFRAGKVDRLPVVPSVARARVARGALTPEEARHSPYQHVLHKFLGCAGLNEGAEVRPLTPQAGDRLLLASDGLTNHITEEDLCQGSKQFANPQDWVEHLVRPALERGPRENVACVVLAFETT